MTEKQALALIETRFWEDMSDRDIAVFQLWEDRLCMPFDVFHDAVCKTLGSQMWDLSLAMHRNGIKRLLLKKIQRKSLAREDILALIPESKRVLCGIGLEETP